MAEIEVQLRGVSGSGVASGCMRVSGGAFNNGPGVNVGSGLAQVIIEEKTTLIPASGISYIRLSDGGYYATSGGGFGSPVFISGSGTVASWSMFLEDDISPVSTFTDTVSPGHVPVCNDPFLIGQLGVKRTKADIIGKTWTTMIDSLTGANANLAIALPVNWLGYCLCFETPTLDSIDVNSGPTAGGTTVVLTGTSFSSTNNSYSNVEVTFDGVAATFSPPWLGFITRGDAVTFDIPTQGFPFGTNPVSEITCDTPAHAPGVVDVVVTLTYMDGVTQDILTLPASYTYVDDSPMGNWFQLDLPEGPVYELAEIEPDPYELPIDAFVRGVFYPRGTIFYWYLAAVNPTDTGWWLSVDEEFSGAAQVINNGRPKDPRSFREIASFATGTTNMLGGFPGPACVSNNRLIYGAGGYTVGTDSPSIRIHDGRFDREVIRLPDTAASVVPKAIMSMLAANGTIYLSTLDTGTTSADWVGRVFSLDIESGILTPVGDPFTTGHVPYALAWHMGRLWCGTNRQSSAASGKIFYFRPGIDTAWTDDYTLSSSTTAGCTSLLSYKGLLYVGTSNAAAAFAKVLVRSELGVYTTSKTGAGGTAVANNSFPALVEFNGNLYASFFNADTTKVSLVYKFDNTTWTTAYTGATTTLVPFIGFTIDNSILHAIGGGVGYEGTILTTSNGTSWSDKTVFLSQGVPASTALPSFGLVVR